MCNVGKAIGGLFGAKPPEAQVQTLPQAVVVGQPETAKTQIGDSGAAAATATAKKKANSLLSAAGAAGDLGGASVAGATAKPTLGA